MMGHEAKMAITHNFYADYYTMAGIALASCLAMCPVVGFLGRRGGLLLFMILTALASLLQLGLLNCKLEMRAFQEHTSLEMQRHANKGPGNISIAFAFPRFVMLHTCIILECEFV